MEIYGNGSIVALEHKDDKAKCRKWRIKFDTEVGVKSRRFTGTRTQAKAEKERFKQKLISLPAMVLTSGQIPLSEWIDRWMSLRRCDPDLALNTLRANKSQMNHVKEAIGHVRLADITPSLIKSALMMIREQHNLSGTSMNKLFVTLKTCLNDAKFDGLILSNPADLVKAPRLDTKEYEAIPHNDAIRLAHTFYSEPYHSYNIGASIALLTGMRRGEICSLVWDDINDFDFIHVHSTIEADNKTRKDTTKTPSGMRTLPVAPMLKSMLQEWQMLQTARLNRQDIESTPSTSVIDNGTGGILSPQKLYNWWSFQCMNYGLGEFHRIHDLRHTYFTMIGAMGASATVIKSLAGWSSIRMAEKYVHTDMVANEHAVESFGLLISQGVVSGT